MSLHHDKSYNIAKLKISLGRTFVSAALIRPIRQLFILILFIFSASLHAQQLRSSVSPEFAEGLHAKFLQHLAMKLNLELLIVPMPYARRIQALRNGNIDIMVGLKEGHDTNGEFVYLHPSYESMRSGFFVLAKNSHKITTKNDLEGLLMATTIDESAQNKHRHDDLYGLELVPVGSLNQKIEMLLRNRVDMFNHFSDSTIRTLRNRNLSDIIVPADFQRPEISDYYFAVSTKSPWLAQKTHFESVLSVEVAKASFKKIRKQHYQ